MVAPPTHAFDPAAAVATAPDLAGALEALATALERNLPVLRFGVAIVQPDADWLRVLEGRGHGPAARVGARMPRAGTVNGMVVATGRPYASFALSDSAEHLEERVVRDAGAEAYLCAPASHGTEVRGTLNVALAREPEDRDEATALVVRLAAALGAALERDRLAAEVDRLAVALRQRREALNAELGRLDALEPVAAGPAFRRAVEQCERFAVSDAPVLLIGDTGTGKEVLARHLHRSGPRAEGPFLAVNCAALPDGLAESELFGVERGAFTGADRARAGLFVQADGGTLLLDEVGDLPRALQAKLLRVLQDGVVTPIGGDRAVRVDVRIVAATHRDLGEMIAAGAFREDLYHRIAALPIRVPPLAERREDIPALVEHFVRSACHRLRREPPAISGGMLRALAERDYPGNVRELRNLVERALVYSGEFFVLPEEELPRIGDAPPPEPGGWPTLAEAQIAHIRATLLRTRGKLYGPDGAAALLGMPPSTLKSRMIRLGIA